MTNFNVDSWPDIKVPGNWEMQGFGTPIYVEKSPIPPYPSMIPENDNPVGSYKKTFTLPPDWLRRRVYLHFGAVRSAFYVWINGRKVGYSEDSKLPAEFDITEFINAGENTMLFFRYKIRNQPLGCCMSQV